MTKIFSFDLGSGSIGECVREDETPIHLKSLIIDSEFASLDLIRTQRRAFRTRLAHKARESWWIRIAKQAGLPIIATDIKKDKEGNDVFITDERMLREFPKTNDETIYNSALLRIALIEGKKLEGWQIFKAVWSAFQHRGYETNNWKEELSEEEKQAEKEAKEAIKLYKEKLSELPAECQLPCYYEAYQMGLYNPQTKQTVNRLKAAPENARNKDGKEQIIAPRDIVEKELRLLLEQAKKQYPALPDIEYILYGTNRKAHAGIYEHSARKFESEGLLGQKTPRFDNRIIAKCSLIPRLNVCKSKEPLSREVRFLLALKNFRFIKNGQVASFDFEEINELFNMYKGRLLDKGHANYIDKKDIKKYLQNKCYDIFSQDVIPMPKDGGRSRFCRPALRILKELILSGKNPHDFYREITSHITNTDTKKGLVKEDYKFLLAMPNDWYKIHIPDFREEDKNLSQEERLAKIDDLLNSITNAVVRHRLIMLMHRIEYLHKTYGTPDYCIMEIGRDEFLSEEEKNALNKENKERQKNNKRIYEELKKYGLEISHDNMEKYKLCENQRWIDIYNVFDEHKKITPEELVNYDIDHIVPVSSGGADSLSNKVVTARELNQSHKKDKTPYECFFDDKSKWTDFLENIKNAGIDKNSKKYLFLTSKDAVAKAKSESDLQATRYIEKLAQKLISLYFGWGEQTAGDRRRMFVCTGGLTAKIRSRYGLNRLLHKDLNKEEFKKIITDGKLDEKNRSNKRHHALDALVISFANNIKYDEKGKPVLPDFACKPNFFADALDKVFPVTIRSKKPILGDTIYALRARQEGKELKYYMVSRFNTNMEKISDAQKNVEKIFDLYVKKQFKDKINQLNKEEKIRWQTFLEDLRASGKYTDEISIMENLSDAPKNLKKISDSPIKDIFKDKLNQKQKEWEQFLKDFRICGNPVRKMCMTESSAFTKKEVFNDDGSFKKNIGEYCAISKKVKGQYIRPKKSNKGQIIYNDGKKWIVKQIYPFDSVAKKLKEAKEKYGKVLFWHTDITLCICNEIKGTKVIKTEDNNKKRIPYNILPGKYRLNTISSGVEITDLSSGIIYAVSLKTLIEEGKAYKERS